MKTISLFSGVGGMDLGFHRAGFEHVAFCEADPYRRKVLARHWPGVPVHEDVRTFEYDGQVDCLVGGFPCQDLSLAGKRAGLAGERSGLFYDAIRIADRVVRPGGFLVLENVAGLLSSNGGRDFGIVLRSLADIGFARPAWRLLDSQFFNVPQRRRRIFIVAQRSESDVSKEVLALTEGSGRNTSEGGTQGEKDSRGFGQSVAETSGKRGTRSRTELDGHGAYVQADTGIPTVANCLQTTAGDYSRADQFNMIPVKTIAFHHKQDPISGKVSPALSKNADGMGVMSVNENQLGDVYETTVASCLGKGGGKPGQGYAAVREDTNFVRRLTPVECERLQAWPDGWTLLDGPSLVGEPRWFEEGYEPNEAMPLPDGRRYAACGDGVTSTVAEWVAQRLIGVSAGRVVT